MDYPWSSKTDEYRIACVLDEFSYRGYQCEADLIQLDPEDWQETLLRHKPQFLLVESAWRGQSLRWRQKVGGLEFSQDQTLRQLANWCRSQALPSVFWNKEDPANFGHFIAAARYFDFVFTTDICSLPRYRDILGHDRVFDLMFAAQPILHNPINKDQEKIGRVAFAGTWYNQKHPARRTNLRLLLTPALDYDLHIYDRMFESKHKNYLFPEIYQHCIKGCLTYDEMLAVYKKYHVFLNVNSVSESPTMFSRRVFELLACGTPVISSYSAGIAQLFPEVVKLCHTEADTALHLEDLLGDEEYRDKVALQGQRMVFNRHTYKQRLARMVDCMGLKAIETYTPGVTIVSICKDPKAVRQAISCFQDQNYTPKELIILKPSGGSFNFDPLDYQIPGQQHILLLSLRLDALVRDTAERVLGLAHFPYISFFAAGDYYAPDFLVDLMHAFTYTEADVVGKSSFYRGEGGRLILSRPQTENRYVDSLWGSALVLRRELVDPFNDQFFSGFEHQYVSAECFSTECRLYAADRFNYICQPQSPGNSRRVVV